MSAPTPFEEFVHTFARAVELGAGGSVGKGRQLLQHALANAEKRPAAAQADQLAEHCRIALHCYVRRYLGEG